MPEALGEAWAVGWPGGWTELGEAREAAYRRGGRAALGEAFGMGKGGARGGGRRGGGRAALAGVGDAVARETNGSIGSNLKNLMRFWVIHLAHWALF